MGTRTTGAPLVPSRLKKSDDIHELQKFLGIANTRSVKQFLKNPNLKDEAFVNAMAATISSSLKDKLAIDQKTYRLLPARFVEIPITIPFSNPPFHLQVSKQLLTEGMFPFETAQKIINRLPEEEYMMLAYSTKKPQILRELAWQSGIYAPEEKTEWETSIAVTGQAKVSTSKDFRNRILMQIMGNFFTPDNLLCEALKQYVEDNSNLLDMIYSMMSSRARLSENVREVLRNNVASAYQLECLFFSSHFVDAEKVDLLERNYFEDTIRTIFTHQRTTLVNKILQILETRLYEKATAAGLNKDDYPLDWLIEVFGTDSSMGFNYVKAYKNGAMRTLLG